MREKLEVAISFIASSLTGIYIMLYVFKEDEVLRFVFGEVLIGGTIFILLILLFDAAKKREIREKKRRKKKWKDTK